MMTDNDEDNGETNGDSWVPADRGGQGWTGSREIRIRGDMVDSKTDSNWDALVRTVTDTRPIK